MQERAARTPVGFAEAASRYTRMVEHRDLGAARTLAFHTLLATVIRPGGLGVFDLDRLGAVHLVLSEIKCPTWRAGRVPRWKELELMD